MHFRGSLGFFRERLRGVRVIAIARNPYQTILSRLNHMARFEDYKKGQAIRASKEQLREELNLFIKKLNKDSHPKTSATTHPPVMHRSSGGDLLEHLQTEPNQFLASLNISEDVSLPHLKKGQNLPRGHSRCC